jgi:hypothetical protein
MKVERLFWLGWFAIAAGLGLSSFWLPAPLPDNAPSASFSAFRAVETVKSIAQAPHPVGSEENGRVREYLRTHMRDLGLQPRVFKGTRSGIAPGNLYGELAGSQPSKPFLLLVAHYDSVPSGPGASDDGAGVATVLETIRTLKARGPLRNSIGVLLTDGEERGLLGASTFVDEHADLVRDVRLVVNLEARGNHGPVVMFQTAPDNARMIELFSKACPLPVAASFSQDVYSRMPNDTDFTVFMRAGKRGLNFAFVGGLAYYHSPRDTPENLSLRTLQHYGDCVLGVADYLGRANDRVFDGLTRKGDATFFTLWRGLLVHYPARMAKALALATVAFFLLVLGKGFWNSTLRVRGFAASLGASLLAAALALIIGAATVFALVHLFKARNYGPFILGIPFEGGFLAILLVAGAMITFGLRSWLLRNVTSSEALAGALVPWAALTLATTAALPGGSYLFLWPTLFGSIALLFEGDAVHGVGMNALRRALLTAVPAPLLLAPTILLLHQTITLGFAPASMVLATFSICLMPWRRDARFRTGS